MSNLLRCIQTSGYDCVPTMQRLAHLSSTVHCNVASKARLMSLMQDRTFRYRSKLISLWISLIHSSDICEVKEISRLIGSAAHLTLTPLNRKIVEWFRDHSKDHV